MCKNLRAYYKVKRLTKKSSDFSEWLDFGDFTQEIKSISPKQYPIVIEAGSLLGDSVVFRVLLKQKPSNSFRYDYVYNVNEAEFAEQNAKFSQLGFTLIYHQVVQLMARKSHQAVWIKDDV